MSFRLTAICDRCGREQNIKQLPDHPAAWTREIEAEGWEEISGDDICGPCMNYERDELAAARDARAQA